MSGVARPAVRRRLWVEVAALCLVAVTLGATVWAALDDPVLEGDTSGVVAGAEHVVDCLHHDVFTHCQTFVGPTPTSDLPRAAHVGPWPVMQFIPAVTLRWFGVSHDTTLRTLIVLNALALGVLVAVAWITTRRRCAAVWTPTLAVVLLTGPMLWYGVSAFGEALGAAFVVCAVAAVLLRARPWIVATIVAAACLTKETNPAFIAALVGLCLLLEQSSPTRAPWTRRILAPTIGVVAGVAINSAFNVFRYGTVRNVDYLQEFYRVPNSGIAARSFLAQWFAPNGGFLWFWPAALALLGLVVIGSVRGLRRPPRSWSQGVPLAVAALLVVEVAALSTWFSPFGWLAWGPRLTLTLLPAMLLIVCVAADRHVTRMLERALASRAFWVGLVLVVAAALPQAAVVYQPRVIIDFFSAPDRHCAPDGHVTTRPMAYYRCVSFTAWSKQPFMLERGLDGLDANGGRLITATMTGATVGLLLMARARARVALARSREREPAAVEHPLPGSADGPQVC